MTRKTRRKTNQKPDLQQAIQSLESRMAEVQTAILHNKIRVIDTQRFKKVDTFLQGLANLVDEFNGRNK